MSYIHSLGNLPNTAAYIVFYEATESEYYPSHSSQDTGEYIARTVVKYEAASSKEELVEVLQSLVKDRRRYKVFTCEPIEVTLKTTVELVI